MSEPTAVHLLLRVIVTASVVHILLPPYEFFAKFPRFQKYYQVIVEVIAWLALNARGRMIQAYPSMRGAQDSVDKPPMP